MNANIVVIDYGMGNVRSVEKALAHCGAAVEVTADAEKIHAATHVVLPGVGAFGGAMKELKKRRLIEPIRETIAADKPFLGICLGLQVLFEKSEESPRVEGLGVIAGQVKRFRTYLKVPHMGWNQLRLRQPGAVFEGVGEDPFVYFVHSYYVVPDDAAWVAATTDYDGEFVSAVRRGRCIATQFHPEKSQAVGLRMLRNFIGLTEEAPADS